MQKDSNAMLIDTVNKILRLLVKGDYDEIERITNGVRLSSEEIEIAVRDYGETLVHPPQSDIEKLDAIEVEGSNPRRWSVRVNLWTKEEGMSDLSMELTIEEGAPSPKIEFDDLHIL